MVSWSCHYADVIIMGLLVYIRNVIIVKICAFYYYNEFFNSMKKFPIVKHCLQLFRYLMKKCDMLMVNKLACISIW